MSTSLEITEELKDDKVTYYFSGAIDEDSDFSLITSSEKNIIFDFDNVTLINSCGIREWINFQETIDKSCQLHYKNCPQVIVEQMNIIKGFVRSGGIIDSFYAPYYDEKTDREVKKLITPLDVVDSKAPELKNDEGDILEFDDIEAQYFNFLKNS